jgi:hypothetical protein
MQSETKKFMGIWSGSVAVACLALMLGFASTGYGDIIMGNFESADSCDGWGPVSWDAANAILTPACANGVTLGSGSLRVAWSYKYWAVLWSPSSVADFPKSSAGCQIKLDLTMYSSDFNTAGTWVYVGNGGLNSDNGWGGLPEATAVDRTTGASTAVGSYFAGTDTIAKKTLTYDISDYNMAGITWFNFLMSAQVSMGSDQNEYGSGVFYIDNVRLIPPTLDVKKCTVAAGKTQYMGDSDFNDMKDTFTASGTISGFPADLNTISHIDVNIVSADGNTIFFEANDFNYMRNVKKNVYTHKYKITKGNPTEGAITSMTIDFKKKTFAVTVTNADLTGLACPLQLIITIGDFVIADEVTETIVNGAKKTIPTRLMRTYKDTLFVTKAKVKNSSKASADSLSVNGELAAKDFNESEPNLYASDVVITWRSADDTKNQTFTIPKHSFKIPRKGRLYKCSKINPTVTPVADANTMVAASIDFDKCAFAVSISKADINAVSGDVKFGLKFTNADLNDFNEMDNLNLALGH